jgi:hypothetical protein
MSNKEEDKYQYTMISNEKGETSLNFNNPSGMNGTDNLMHDDDPYDITKLDYAWFPVLRKNLQSGSEISQDGVPLVRVSSHADDTVDYVPSSDRHISSVDEIDARGSFNAQELERDLRQMRRQELGKYL